MRPYDVTAEAKDAEVYAAIMAKYRLTKLSVGMLSLEMSPLGFATPEAEKDTPTGDKAERMPTEDELLLWSSGGPPPDVEAGAPKE